MTQSRAWSDASEAWGRARVAFLAVLGDQDPAAAYVAEGAVDLRPAPAMVGVVASPTRVTLLSGPRDLVELRAVVERALGVDTWPAAPARPETEAIVATISVDRSADLLGLLVAMEGLIEDRSPWRKWRTAIDTIAPAVAQISELTVETHILRSLE